MFCISAISAPAVKSKVKEDILLFPNVKLDWNNRCYIISTYWSSSHLISYLLVSWRTILGYARPNNCIMYTHTVIDSLIDDYAKMADQRWSDVYVVFTKILCSRNFYVWYVTKLEFTGKLRMASLSLYPQFETNLISNRKVIELLLQLKSAKIHGKNYIKVRPPRSAIFSVIVYIKSRIFVKKTVIRTAL